MLYGAYLESEMLLELKMARMTAQSALMAHPDTDYDKAVGASRNMYRDVLAAIDYVSGGRSGMDMLQDERQAFVKKYLELRKKSLKEPQVPVSEETLEIKEVGT